MQSTSSSKSPRNLKQIYNRKNLINKNFQVINEVQSSNDHLQTLISAQKDPESLIKTVTITKGAYIAFGYTNKQANLKKIIQREENDEMRALYVGNYVLSPDYKRFQVSSHTWHSWNEDRSKDHVEKFRSYVPSIGDSFMLPGNSGRKPE